MLISLSANLALIAICMISCCRSKQYGELDRKSDSEESSINWDNYRSPTTSYKLKVQNMISQLENTIRPGFSKYSKIFRNFINCKRKL